MTIQDVIRVVADETGKEVTSQSKLSDLVDDSLEFTNLMVRVSEENRAEIADRMIPQIETVYDLYLAALSARQLQANLTGAQ